MTLRFLSGVCLTLLLCLSGTAMAAEAKAPAAKLTPSIDDPVIAVLDVQQVLRRAAAAKGISAISAHRRLPSP